MGGGGGGGGPPPPPPTFYPTMYPRAVCNAGFGFESGTCTICPAGKYSFDGLGSCMYCPSGSSSSYTGAILCTCDSDKVPSYSPDGGLLNCVSCPAGTYASATTLSGGNVCPDGYTYYAGSDFSGCYKYGDPGLSWYDAAAACNRAYGGWLVTVDSSAENTYVYELDGTYYPKWIGANDITSFTTNSYVNIFRGQAVTYNNFFAPEPSKTEYYSSGEKEQCVQILGSHENDIRCAPSYAPYGASYAYAGASPPSICFPDQWNDFTCSASDGYGTQVSSAYVCENYAINSCLSYPTAVPTATPTVEPTAVPTAAPTVEPTAVPTAAPTVEPTAVPTAAPTIKPTAAPTVTPTIKPTAEPTVTPTVRPTTPTSHPTSKPSAQPSAQPSSKPSSQPSRHPSSQPSRQPSSRPSSQPSSQPSSRPSRQPSSRPSSQPSSKPSSRPSRQPSSRPSSQPSSQPSSRPSRRPSSRPSSQPSSQPSSRPSRRPSSRPSSQPSSKPSSQPSEQPSSDPSSQPSSQPSLQPSSKPSSRPSSQPSSEPSSRPSSQPSSLPSSQPAVQPSSLPSSQPTSSPTSQPTRPNVLLLNPLEQEWTRAFIMIKINAYLLAYVIFFVCLFLFLFLLDKSGALKSYSDALHASSLESRVYMPAIWNVNKSNRRSAGGETTEIARNADPSRQTSGRARRAVCRTLLMESINRRDIERRKQYDELIKEVDGTPSAEGQLSIDVSPPSASASDDKSSRDTAAEKKAANAEFNDYLLLRRCYLGCSAIFFEGGLNIPLLGVTLREGLAENFLLYLMNNHSIASCVYACKQSSHSRNSRRWVLIVQHAIGFFITNIVAVLLLEVGAGAVYGQATEEPAASYFSCQLFDIFFTAPVSLMFAEGFRRLYRCDVSVSTIEKHPTYVRALTTIRKRLVIPLIIVGVFVLLVVCSVLTTGQRSSGNVANYMRDVFMVTVVLDSVAAMTSFVSTYHYAVYLFGGWLCPLSIGQLYVELLIVDGKQEGMDYRVSSFVKLRGFIRIDRIDDITDSMTRGDSGGHRPTDPKLSRQSSFSQTNPMHQRKTIKPAEAIEGGRSGTTLEMPRSRSQYMPPPPAPATAIDKEDINASLYPSLEEVLFEVVNPLYASRQNDVDIELATEGVMDANDGTADQETSPVVDRLHGRRASFVKKFIFFENLYGPSIGRAPMDCHQSMAQRARFVDGSGRVAASEVGDEEL